MSSWDEKEAKRLFQKLPFCNSFSEKPKITGLKNFQRFYSMNLLFMMNQIFMQCQKQLGGMQELIKLK